MYGWGNNEYGQVGVASENEQICEPVPLNLSSLDGQIISVATGGAFTAFLTSNIEYTYTYFNTTFRGKGRLGVYQRYTSPLKLIT